MRRKIKYLVMNETAINLKQQLIELVKERNQLLTDINKINDGYKGKDATIIIEKYKNRINYIDEFVLILEKYQICFEWMSGNYKNSHDKVTKNLELEMPILDDINIISNNYL